eukprot:6322472-Pyramimonas_sp.AAC.1
MAPSRQAGITAWFGSARKDIAMIVPSAIIKFGVDIGGRHTDGVTYIMFLLGTKFEHLEEERQFDSGAALIDFR